MGGRREPRRGCGEVGVRPVSGVGQVGGAFLGRVFLLCRRPSCLCLCGLFLGCQGSKCCSILNSGGPEGGVAWGWNSGFSWRGPFFQGGSSSDPAVASCSGNSELSLRLLDRSKLHPGASIGIAACVSSGLYSAFS